jgi:hypothetical protein
MKVETNLSINHRRGRSLFLQRKDAYSSTFIQTNPLKIDSMILFITDDTNKSLNDVRIYNNIICQSLWYCL